MYKNIILKKSIGVKTTNTLIILFLLCFTFTFNSNSAYLGMNNQYLFLKQAQARMITNQIEKKQTENLKLLKTFFDKTEEQSKLILRKILTWNSQNKDDNFLQNLQSLLETSENFKKKIHELHTDICKIQCVHQSQITPEIENQLKTEYEKIKELQDNHTMKNIGKHLVQLESNHEKVITDLLIQLNWKKYFSTLICTKEKFDKDQYNSLSKYENYLTFIDELKGKINDDWQALENLMLNKNKEVTGENKWIADVCLTKDKFDNAIEKLQKIVINKRTIEKKNQRINTNIIINENTN